MGRGQGQRESPRAGWESEWTWVRTLRKFGPEPGNLISLFILFYLFYLPLWGGRGGGVAVRACVIIYICQPLAAYVSKCTYTYDQQSTLEEVLF